jgi:alpha-galactosidase
MTVPGGAMSTPTITLIGAGSSTFCLTLIRDLCLTPKLAGSRITLMDVDERRLDSAFALCQRYAAEVGIPLSLRKTTDRRDSLEGADFVVNTALAFGKNRWQEGWDVARRHGYRFGGSYHVMHDEAFWINFYQYRLHEAVLRDILEICPGAWYVLVANPVCGSITYLQRRYPQARMVGLCHGYYDVYGLAAEIGLPREGLTFELPGVNHFLWLTKLYSRGENALPRLDQWLGSKGERFREEIPWKYGLGPAAFDLYRRFGAFPIGDTCTPGGGSWPYWYHTDDATERQWKEDPQGWWDESFRDAGRNVAEIERAARDRTRKVTSVFPPVQSGETMVPMIESLAFDVPRVQIVNILNTGGLVPGVPESFQVEVPALVSARGIQGIRTDGLPPPLIQYILRDRVAPVEMELLAFERHSRELLLQLVLMDPWTRSTDQASGLLAEIMALPCHDEMRSYYQ